MSTSNGYHQKTATLPHVPDTRVRDAQELADSLALDLDGLAFDLDLILPDAIPAIMKKLEGVRRALAQIHKMMDEAAKPLQPVVIPPSNRRLRSPRPRRRAVE